MVKADGEKRNGGMIMGVKTDIPTIYKGGCPIYFYHKMTSRREK